MKPPIQISTFLRNSAIFILPENLCIWFFNFKKKIRQQIVFVKNIFREKKQTDSFKDFPQTKWRLNSPAQEE